MRFLGPLLAVKDLVTVFYGEARPIAAVDGVSFEVGRGETLGIVGESGCGKSVTSLSVMRLIPNPPGRILNGEILFEDRDILGLSKPQMRKVRGNEISMIFQEPMTSLNPVFTVGTQISEAIRLHQGLGKKEAISCAVEMLRLVGIPTPQQRVKEYPHQMSGGMRQRVMIAMALSCNPKLLIADEPTTALDVTIQAQILELMRDLKSRIGMAVMLITHDLGVVAEVAERVLVMYAGVIVEESPVAPLFEEPLHPYTQGLLASIPRLDMAKTRLHMIKGVVPNPLGMPKGCRFSPRCDHAEGRCLTEEPPLANLGDGRKVRCWRCTAPYARGTA